MQIQVDHAKAQQVLGDTLRDASKFECLASPYAAEIEQIVMGDHLTYRYVLMTALLAKAVDARANPLSLQAGANLDGAYDARSLCHKVFVPFERQFLDSGLGGSNEPFLNKPARFTHISRENAVRGGNDRQTLELLCRLLPQVTTLAEARACLTDAIRFVLKRVAAAKTLAGASVAIHSSRREILNFTKELTLKSFEGETCSLAVGALLDIWGTGYWPEFVVEVHPVNECGASSNQISDIDAYVRKSLAITMEVKDKLFSTFDVQHAVKKVRKASFDTLVFVKGPNATLTDGDERVLVAGYGAENFFLKIFTVMELSEVLVSLMTPTSSSQFLKALLHHAAAARAKDETLRHIQVIAKRFGWL